MHPQSIAENIRLSCEFSLTIKFLSEHNQDEKKKTCNILI